MEYQAKQRKDRALLGVMVRFGCSFLVSAVVGTIIVPWLLHRRFDSFDLLGVGIWVLVACAFLRLGLAIRRRSGGKQLVERHHFLTEGTGVFLAQACVLEVEVVNHLPGDDGVIGGMACIIGFMIATAWIVFRPMRDVL